jgi:hypothetical protein
MKLQRYEAKTVYKAVIEQLYKEGELPVKWLFNDLLTNIPLNVWININIKRWIEI